MTLSVLILLSLLVGIVVGVGGHSFFPATMPVVDDYFLSPLGAIFLRLIQFVVVPLVFCSLILGLTGIKDTRTLGRYLLKLFTSYFTTTIVAVTIGMSVALLMEPGKGTNIATTTVEIPDVKPSLIDWLVTLVPTNLLDSLSSGDLLQTIIAAALISIAIQSVGEKAASFLSFTESVYTIFEKVLFLVLYTAPVGVFALITSVVATQGIEVITSLLFYLIGTITSFGLMIVFYCIVLGLFRVNPVKFFKGFSPSLSLAFGSASSNAALPVALNDAITYGMKEGISSFALPLGTALKRDGTAVFQGFNAIFIAQVYHIPLTNNLLITIALASFLISYSTAGVPGGGLIAMTTVLSAAGLPLEGVALVAGVDRINDGFKSIVNVLSNIVNAVILNIWEEE